MTRRHQPGKAIAFNTIQLFKDQTLGIGSYGKVCKVKCDDLLCAAKLLHETLIDPTAHQLIAPQREHRLPMRRFEQECEFLSTIRHPNIVQYLGIYQDPDTGLPALLMELMDDNLTHFLESSPQQIPYHIQVNICHDIALALSFLHSNGIIHRDLSSNNVLLIGNVRAKVTDFGMARLGDQNQQLTFTMCPGTDVYMPPEAVQEEPVYTEKIDCFSFGVITVQILTQKFPKPGNRRKKVQINHPGLPSGALEMVISEVERRHNHIGEINPNHTLLKVALHCLKDKDIERPSTQQLCERVAALKTGPQYSESIKAIDLGLDRRFERDRELRLPRQQPSQQIQGLQWIIQSQASRLNEKDQMLGQKDETIAAGQLQLRLLESEKNQAIEEKERLERQLRHINQQLRESERVNAQFQRQITQLRSPTDATFRDKEQSSGRASIMLTWREGEKAPYGMSTKFNAAIDGLTLYVRVSHRVYAYTISTSSWHQLPDSPTDNCPSVIINNLLTFVGGYHYSPILTNQLFSLTGEGSGRRWTEEFPPMPTKRCASTTLYTGAAVIVAGGRNKDSLTLKVVEMLNTETLQWSTAADLPQPLASAPAAVCSDHIYIIGESNMHTCSVMTIIQSHKSLLANLWTRDARVWRKAAAPPVTYTACVSIHGRLLAIGGKNSYDKPSKAIHMYDPTTDSWELISQMKTPRYKAITAILPTNQLLVVGGITVDGILTDSVELAAIRQ